MIATAVPTRRREVLAIDIGTVLRPIWASVNPSEQITEKFPPFGSGAHLAPVPPWAWGVSSLLGQFTPVLVMRHLAAYCLGIQPSNCGGDRSWAWHVSVVNRIDGTYFSSCSTAENFFSDVEV